MHESGKWKGSRSVVPDSSQPHGLQPTRLLRPWGFPGKSTGVGCHCLLRYSFLDNLLSYTLESPKPTVYACWLLAMTNYFLISFVTFMWTFSPCETPCGLGCGCTLPEWLWVWLWHNVRGICIPRWIFSHYIFVWLELLTTRVVELESQLVWCSRVGFRNLRKDFFFFLVETR